MTSVIVFPNFARLYQFSVTTNYAGVSALLQQNAMPLFQSRRGCNEAVKLSAFTQWCTDAMRTKGIEIAEVHQKMDECRADVEEMPDESLFYRAAEANGYEFQFGGIIDMLVKLGDEFGTTK